ncbi:unnamed protein product [Periconia digitata]|uniref:Uncharacterized protein n=1 Tax=Periconia digitata TaxID=1303443 RepID=A0A9W4U1W0_9PLEO|nr:unnamed protein product [Periconia digitata]
MSIAEHHARCVQKFEQLSELVAGISALPTTSAASLTTEQTDVNEEIDRYILWAENVGAHHSGSRSTLSLDYRLREASFYRDRVLDLMNVLERYLDKSIAALLPPSQAYSEESESESGSNSYMFDEAFGSERPLDEDASSSWNISDTDSNLSTEKSRDQVISSISAENDTNRDDGIAIRGIRHTIDCFFQLPLRRPAPINRLREESEHELRYYEPFDILYVRDKFPNVAEQITARLGKLITRRRQLLLYRKKHQKNLQNTSTAVPEPALVLPDRALTTHIAIQKTAEVVEEGTVSEPTIRAESQRTKITALTKATTLANDFPVSHTEESRPATSIAASETTRKVRLHIPPRPLLKSQSSEPIVNAPSAEQPRRVDAFKCNYCQLLPTITSDAMWKRHVISDLQPYVCTFLECDLASQFFPDRDTWYAHEKQHHRLEYHCNISNHTPFDTEQAFSQHMKSTHAVLIQLHDLDAVRKMFLRPVQAAGGACNLCGAPTNNLKIHISRHLEQLALFAIPRSDYTGGEGDGRDDDSNMAREESDGSSPQSSSISTSSVTQQKQLPRLFELPQSVLLGIIGYLTLRERARLARVNSYLHTQVSILTAEVAAMHAMHTATHAMNEIIHSDHQNSQIKPEEVSQSVGLSSSEVSPINYDRLAARISDNSRNPGDHDAYFNTTASPDRGGQFQDQGQSYPQHLELSEEDFDSEKQALNILRREKRSKTKRLAAPLEETSSEDSASYKSPGRKSKSQATSNQSKKQYAELNSTDDAEDEDSDENNLKSLGWRSHVDHRDVEDEPPSGEVEEEMYPLSPHESSSSNAQAEEKSIPVAEIEMGITREVIGQWERFLMEKYFKVWRKKYEKTKRDREFVESLLMSDLREEKRRKSEHEVISTTRSPGLQKISHDRWRTDMNNALRPRSSILDPPASFIARSRVYPRIQGLKPTEKPFEQHLPSNPGKQPSDDTTPDPSGLNAKPSSISSSPRSVSGNVPPGPYAHHIRNQSFSNNPIQLLYPEGSHRTPIWEKPPRADPKEDFDPSSPILNSSQKSWVRVHPGDRGEGGSEDPRADLSELELPSDPEDERSPDLAYNDLWQSAIREAGVLSDDQQQQQQQQIGQETPDGEAATSSTSPPSPAPDIMKTRKRMGETLFADPEHLDKESF